jgi:hypothetical protein
VNLATAGACDARGAQRGQGIWGSGPYLSLICWYIEGQICWDQHLRALRSQSSVTKSAGTVLQIFSYQICRNRPSICKTQSAGTGVAS